MSEVTYRDGPIAEQDIQIKYKSANQSETTATEQDDDHLIDFKMEAGAEYLVEGYIRWGTSALGVDISLQFVASVAVVTAHITGISGDVSGNLDSDYSAGTAVTTLGDMVFTELTDNGACWTHIKGYVVANASSESTLKLTWGRETAAGTTTVYRGSWLRLTRVV